jgi:hypothetical protein
MNVLMVKSIYALPDPPPTPPVVRPVAAVALLLTQSSLHAHCSLMIAGLVPDTLHEL